MPLLKFQDTSFQGSENVPFLLYTTDCQIRTVEQQALALVILDY